MEALKNEGIFTVDAQTKANMDRFVVGGTADEAETLATIQQCYEQNHYLLDTHTAVALKSKSGIQTGKWKSAYCSGRFYRPSPANLWPVSWLLWENLLKLSAN